MWRTLAPTARMTASARSRPKPVRRLSLSRKFMGGKLLDEASTKTGAFSELAPSCEKGGSRTVARTEAHIHIRLAARALPILIIVAFSYFGVAFHSVSVNFEPFPSFRQPGNGKEGPVKAPGSGCSVGRIALPLLSFPRKRESRTLSLDSGLRIFAGSALSSLCELDKLAPSVV